jgi:hypothetical protein
MDASRDKKDDEEAAKRTRRQALRELNLSNHEGFSPF